MTKRHIILILLALMAMLCLSACGDEVFSDSDTEGIQTFGTATDPDTQTAYGETVAGQEASGENNTSGTSTGVITEGNSGSSSQSGGTTGSGNSGTPSGTSSGGSTTKPSPSSSTSKPGGNSGGPNQSDTQVTPSTSPTNTPAPPSKATADEVRPYIGKSLSELISAVGYPRRSDYEDVNEDDPDTDRIGTLYFNGFIVTTLRTADGETITGVTVTGSDDSQQDSDPTPPEDEGEMVPEDEAAG